MKHDEGRVPVEAIRTHAALYDGQRARLLAMCAAILGDQWAAEDAVHEAFARLAACAPRLRADPTAYLFTVARNICRDELRRRRRRPGEELDCDLRADIDVEARAVDRHTIAELWPRLSPAERALFVDTATGFSLGEIAHRCGSTVSAVAQRVHRARMRARRIASLPALVPGLVHELRSGRGAGRLVAPVTVGVVAIAFTGGTPSSTWTVPSPPAVGAAPAPAVARGPAGAQLPSAKLVQTLAAAPAAGHPTSVQPVAPESAAPPATSPIPTAESVTATTASPNYDHDHTVFASGPVAPGCPRCTPLYRSDDGGHSWQPRAARGFTGGTILLPPAFPADSTIFALQRYTGLLRSDDGGAGFQLAAPLASGTAAVDPTSPPGDTSVYLLDLTTGTLTVYDAASRTTGAGPTLPPDVTRVTAVFSAAHAGAVLVSATGPVTGSALFSCVRRSCRRVASAPGGAPVISDSFALDQTLFSAVSNGVAVDHLGGNTQTLALETPWSAAAILPAHDYATSGVFDVVAVASGGARASILRSIGGGAFTARPLGLDGTVASLSLVSRLPDGRLLAPLHSGGLWCSLDDGASWHPTC